jgi:hypothetical protein
MRTLKPEQRNEEEVNVTQIQDSYEIQALILKSNN